MAYFNVLSKNLYMLFLFSGLIFETEIQAGDDSRFFQQSLEQYWKQVSLLSSSWVEL